MTTTMLSAAPGTIALRRREETPPTGGVLVTVEPLLIIGWRYDDDVPVPLTIGGHLRSKPTPAVTDPAEVVAILHAANAVPPAVLAGVCEAMADRLALAMAATGVRSVDAADHMLTAAALIAVGGNPPEQVMDAPCGPLPGDAPCIACEVMASLLAAEAADPRAAS